MNYYIQGSPTKADKIRAAFEKLGYDTSRHLFNAKSVLYFTLDGEIRATTCNCTPAIIKTHPDYQELELPVESEFKFKVGDWLYHNTLGVRPILVKGYNKRHGYKVECSRTTYYLQKGVVENEYHLWTIADAKDGDVLATDGIICIFKKLDKDGYYIISPCIYTVKDGLEVIDDEDDSIGSCGFKPATKEDQELLFRKMKEAGYQWDADKKELKKIQPHYDIENFKPYQKVLIRFGNNDTWRADFFSHIKEDRGRYFVGIGYANKQCIPFEGNEHLLGTTDMCPEEYINW